jgi:hypothetical protein
LTFFGSPQYEGVLQVAFDTVFRLARGLVEQNRACRLAEHSECCPVWHLAGWISYTLSIDRREIAGDIIGSIY